MEPCPNCHGGSVRPHTWMCCEEVDGVDVCLLCRSVLPVHSPYVQVIRTKAKALEGELEILRKMMPHTIAFDAQLHLCMSLMIDIRDCRDCQLAEDAKAKEVPEDEQIPGNIRPPRPEPTGTQARNLSATDEGDDGACAGAKV